MAMTRDVKYAELFVIGKDTTLTEVVEAVNSSIIVLFEWCKGKNFDFKWYYTLFKGVPIIFRHFLFMSPFSLSFSSSSFQYYCTCVSRCESRIVKCDIDSKNRNACKKCRYVKYTNSWILYRPILRNVYWIHSI